MRLHRVHVLLVLLSCVACWSAASASRLAPEDQQLSTAGPTHLPSTDRLSAATAPTDSTTAATDSSDADDPNKKKHKGSIDFADQDPDVRSHWALLVAGSSGWFNYRHQADVFHAYQVLLAGGYRRDHIVVMAADDIAQDAENPMPGKVFNMPGGPNVYEGVRIDYRGPDVTADNFLAVLLGDAAAMAGKGTGRVVDSGPRDKVFVFYSDHGAAGVLGMPNGPFLYADEFIKTLKKKHNRKGFKEAVLYIEACESGSMFEGLLGNDLDIYVTTAANAIESSWATYCPTFYTSTTDGDNTAAAMSNGGRAGVRDSGSSSSSGGWKVQLLRGLGWLQQQLGRITGAPLPGESSAAAAAVGAVDVGGVKPTPEFTTCLGDLYSVAWMEDAEASDLTQETLLQQYKKIKVRTSQNFTYDQGSHVMHYGDLDIDKELAGDYEGMAHNGSSPSPTLPSQDWIDHAAAVQQQQQGGVGAAAGMPGSKAMLQRYSSPEAFLNRLKASSSSSKANHTPKKRQHASVEQRDADLVPLAAAAQHSSCPHKRAAAAAALRQATAARQALEGRARAAVAHLLRQPQSGYVMMTHLGRAPGQVLLQGAGGLVGGVTAGGSSAQQQQQVLGEVSLLRGDVVQGYVEALLGPLPGRAGEALVGDWQCLRDMVQVWQGECGQLDQYGMKLTRLFANLCNAGVQPQQLQGSLAAGPCSGLP